MRDVHTVGSMQGECGELGERGTGDMLRRQAFRLPPHPASVPLARLRARDHLSAWGVRGGALDDSVLLVSELVTHVVRQEAAPGREFEVAVTVLADASCLVEVSDDGSPRWEESGLGGQLVEAVASAWGVWGRGAYGTTMWAVVGRD